MIAFIKFIGTLLLGCIISELQSKYRGELLYLCRNERLLTPVGVKNQDVKIIYKRRKIKALSVAKILIVNNSQHVLKETDLSGKGLLIKQIGEGKILRVDIQKSVDMDNIYSSCITPDRKNVSIKFHHMNPGESYLFQVFHTGLYSDDLICQCTAAGIINVRNICIEGKSNREFLLMIPFQFLFFLFLSAIGLDFFEKGGWISWVGIFLWVFIVLLVWKIVSLWELDYRFKKWYKIARDNGF